MFPWEKKRPEEYITLENEYLKRLSPYIKIDFTLIKSSGSSSKSTVLKQKEKEGDDILKRVSPEAFLCALDPGGKQMSSEEFAAFLEKLQMRNLKQIVFVIGGASGLGTNVLKKADFLLSFSKMTFPHDMVPLILIEQLYRAFSIIKGKNYHK